MEFGYFAYLEFMLAMYLALAFIEPRRFKNIKKTLVSDVSRTKLLLNSFQPKCEGEQIHRTCGKIPVTLGRRFTSRLESLSEIKFQPILFVESSEIRL